MKKSILTIVFLIGSFITYAQNEIFEYKSGWENGKEVYLFKDYLVVEIDSLSAKQLYRKSINWVKETYQSPDVVIKMKIENEKMRIVAIKKNAIKYKGIPLKMKYSIVISFKNGKYKFGLSEVYIYIESLNHWSLVSYPLTLNSKSFDNLKESFLPPLNIINEVYISHKTYMLGLIKEDDW